MLQDLIHGALGGFTAAALMLMAAMLMGAVVTPAIAGSAFLMMIGLFSLSSLGPRANRQPKEGERP